MVPIGYRPIMWHLMQYYAHYGHTDFVLCLGYRGDVDQGVLPRVRRDDLQRLRARQGGKDVELLSTDIDSWTITFVDTGIDGPASASG